MRESDLLINKKSRLNQFFEFSVKVSVFCADMYGVRFKSPANKAPISRGKWIKQIARMLNKKIHGGK